MGEDLKAVLALNVREARRSLRISQDELAARAGLHRTYVGAIERGERNITLESLSRLAAVVGRSPAELLTREHDGG